MLGKWWDSARRFFSGSDREQELRDKLEEIKKKTPTPVFWLLGKTQSGKSTLVRYLTGAEQAEIGKGFKPCTRFSQQYLFPSDQAPLMSFLDTRGLEEPGYDPAEDLARFNEETHLVIITARVLDHAQENIKKHLASIREASPKRPVVLVLTCLHEAYPQQQHPEGYPFGPDGLPLEGAPVPPELTASIHAQKERFAGLFDRLVCVDLTPPEEGFNEPNYGGQRLREVMVDLLPAAHAQTLRTLNEASNELKDFFAQQAHPYIVAYSGMAATAGAIPLPVVDLLALSGVQSRMVYELASIYGQPLSAQRFLEVAGTLGLGMLARQAARSAVKAIPVVGTVLGSVAGGAMAGASTYALGKAFCYYYSVVQQGHVPDPQDLKRYYSEQLNQAQTIWQQRHDSEKKDKS